MDYIIRGTGRTKKTDDYSDVEIPVSLELYDSSRENVSVIFDLGNGRDIWIPYTELVTLLDSIELLVD